MNESKPYYGWWILATITVAGMMAYGPGLYGFTLFLKPLAEEFGWGRAITGGSVSIFWLSAPLVPLIGLWTDKYGARRMILIGAFIEGVCLILISQIESVWQLYTLRAAMGLGKVLIAVPIPIVVAHWFFKRKGLAMGIAFAGWHLGGVLVATPTQYLLNTVGWRSTAVTLGVLIAIVTIPLAAWFMRYKLPSELGLLPDGESIHPSASDPKEQENNKATDTIELEGWTFHQTARSFLFWAIAAITVIYYFAYASILTHQAAFITDIGISAKIAASALGLTAGLAIIGVVGFGIAADKWGHKPLLTIVFVIQIISVILLLTLNHSPNIWLMYLSVILFGLAVGAGDVIWVTLLRTCFGEKEFGLIFGVWYFFMLSAMTVSPFIAGYIYDVTGSYQIAFITALISSCFALAYVLYSPLTTSRQNDQSADLQKQIATQES